MVESDELIATTEPLPSKITRRNFLRGAGTVLLSAFLGSSREQRPTPIDSVQTEHSSDPYSPHETEIEQHVDMLVADITMETFDKLNDLGIPNISLRELSSRLGFEGELSLQTLLSLPVPEDMELATAMAVQIIKFHYANHGDNVVQVMQSVDSHVQIERNQPRLHSIPPHALKNFEITRDDIGNPKVWFEIDGEYLAQLFEQSPENFINLSLELGRLGMDFKVYDTESANPDALDPSLLTQIRSAVTINGKTTPAEYELDGRQLTEAEVNEIWARWSESVVVPRESIYYTPIDGYGSGGDPRDSFGKMAALASRLPNKIIFAAAGNPTSKYGLPSVIGPKAELLVADELPDNLFLIGFFGINYGGEVLPSGYGADYYVNVADMKALDAPAGTSYSTPIVGRLAMQYIERFGLPVTSNSVRQVFDAFSTEQQLGDVWDDTTEITYRSQVAKIIDVARLKEALQGQDISP